jgi:hypothetical protein
MTAKLFLLHPDAYRPRPPAPTMDEEIARAGDVAIMQEIAAWAILRRDMAQARPLGREIRAMAMEMRAIIRNQPRYES